MLYLLTAGDKGCSGWLDTYWNSLLYLLVEMMCSPIWKSDWRSCWRCPFLLLAARGHYLRWNSFWLMVDYDGKRLRTCILSIQRETVEQVDIQQSHWKLCSESTERFDLVLNADIVAYCYCTELESVRCSCKCKRLAMADCQTDNKVCWKDWFIVQACSLL